MAFDGEGGANFAVPNPRVVPAKAKRRPKIKKEPERAPGWLEADMDDQKACDVNPDDYHNDCYEPDALSMLLFFVRMQLAPLPWLARKLRAHWPESSAPKQEMKGEAQTPLPAEKKRLSQSQQLHAFSESQALQSQQELLSAHTIAKIAVLAWLLAGSDRTQVSLTEVFLPVWLESCRHVGKAAEIATQSGQDETELADKVHSHMAARFIELADRDPNTVKDWKKMEVPAAFHKLFSLISRVDHPIRLANATTLENYMALGLYYYMRSHKRAALAMNRILFHSADSLLLGKLSQLFRRMSQLQEMAHGAFLRRLGRISHFQGVLMVEPPQQPVAHFSSLSPEYQKAVEKGEGVKPPQQPVAHFSSLSPEYQKAVEKGEGVKPPQQPVAHFSSLSPEYQKAVEKGEGVTLLVLAEQLLWWPRHPSGMLYFLTLLAHVFWMCVAVACFVVVTLVPDFLRDREINFDFPANNWCKVVSVLWLMYAAKAFLIVFLRNPWKLLRMFAQNARTFRALNSMLKGKHVAGALCLPHIRVGTLDDIQAWYELHALAVASMQRRKQSLEIDFGLGFVTVLVMAGLLVWYSSSDPEWVPGVFECISLAAVLAFVFFSLPALFVGMQINLVGRKTINLLLGHAAESRAYMCQVRRDPRNARLAQEAQAAIDFTEAVALRLRLDSGPSAICSACLLLSLSSEPRRRSDVLRVCILDIVYRKIYTTCISHTYIYIYKLEYVYFDKI